MPKSFKKINLDDKNKRISFTSDSGSTDIMPFKEFTYESKPLYCKKFRRENKIIILKGSN